MVTLGPCRCSRSIVAIVPQLCIIDAKNKRQDKIEQQLDTFLTALANALKASPSLGDALGNTATLIRGADQGRGRVRDQGVRTSARRSIRR